MPMTDGEQTSPDDEASPARPGNRDAQGEHYFRRMIEGISDYAIMGLDVGGKVMSWNEGVARIKGYRRDEIIGKGFEVFYTAADVASGMPGKALALARQHHHFQEEGWRIRKDGSQFWASVLINTIEDDHHQLVGYTKITHDLTQKREAEQELLRSNQFNKAIMEAAPYAIIATDPQGLITSINPAAENILGYHRDELIRSRTLDSLHDASEIVERAKELSSFCGKWIPPGFEVFTYDSRSGKVEEHEWTYIRKNGSRIPVHLAITALHDVANKVVGYLGIAYDITERQRREGHTRHLAHHDHLTGLPNRALLYDRLRQAVERATRDRSRVGVLMIDLDHFKRINDSLGHHVGDRLLTIVADRIVGVVRAADTVARMGGDEFVVVLPDLTNNQDADQVATKIIEAISGPLNTGQHEMVVTPSIGVSCFPDNGGDDHTLLKNADTAMYRAKASGRAAYRHFTDEMEQSANIKLAMEMDLRRAFNDNGLQVYYHPQICLKSGRILAMEALLRWRDPKQGMISPKIFIPVAEDSGLIVPLGDWVLRTACRDAQRLQQKLGFPVIVAVNLSARQLSQGSLQGSAEAALEESGLDPSLLEVEITESVLMDQLEESMLCLEALHSKKISVVMDDFGTGFCSLSYLTQFPINGLKIDQTFISRMTHSRVDLAIIQAIAAMAHSLDLKVIAEGVETDEQMRFLQRHVCDSGRRFNSAHASSNEAFNVQGFRLCEPMPIGQLTAEFERLQISGRQMIYQSLH